MAREKVEVAVISDSFGHSIGLRACEALARVCPDAVVAYVMPDDRQADPPASALVVERPTSPEQLAQVVDELRNRATLRRTK